MTVKKQQEYAEKIGKQLEAMFKKGSKNYINKDELKNPQNMKAFLHALGNITPTVFYNKAMNTQFDVLEFNHIANHIIFDLSHVANVTEKPNE